LLEAEKFKTGQIWKYINRAGEDGSVLTILKIEKYDTGDTILHIRVDGVKIYSPQSATGYSSFIGHLPFSEKSISASVTELAGQNNNLPDFSEGYNQWKEAWDNGKAGYWTIDLKDAIDGIDRIMRPGN
jgi:ribosomal protein S1